MRLSRNKNFPIEQKYLTGNHYEKKCKAVTKWKCENLVKTRYTFVIVGELTSEKTLPCAIRGQSVIFVPRVRVGYKDSEKVWCHVWKSPEVAFWRHSKWRHHGKIMNSHVHHISRTTCHRDLVDPSKCSQDTTFYSCFIQCITFRQPEMAKICKIHIYW